MFGRWRRCAVCGGRPVTRRVCPHLSRPLATLATLGTDVSAQWTSACTGCAASGQGEVIDVCEACEGRQRTSALVPSEADRQRGFVLASWNDAATLREAPRHPIARALPGRWAKLSLSSVPMAQPRHVESLWFEVTSRSDDVLQGTLDNDPEVVEGIARGHRLDFDAEHVVDVGAEIAARERPTEHRCEVCTVDLRSAVHELDSADERLLGDVARYGYHIVALPPEGDEPGYGFTVGLHHRFEHPELVFYAPAMETVMLVLSLAAQEVCDGTRFDGDRAHRDLLERAIVRARPVHDSRKRSHLGYACWFHRYTTDFPALLLQWSDREGRFPGEPGFDGRHDGLHERLDEEAPV